MKDIDRNSINRIIDANINRTKEGLRVCEEVARFILNSRSLTEDLKKARHKIDICLKGLPQAGCLLKQRNSLKDVGRLIPLKAEFRRASFQDVFFANIQRVKESIRVLEEFLKLKNCASALAFKKIRYEIYEIEKKAAQKILNLKN